MMTGDGDFEAFYTATYERLAGQLLVGDCCVGYDRVRAARLPG